MIGQRSAIAALFLSSAMSGASAQELTTDAERTWRELRNSHDVKTQLMAERWYGAIKLQKWSDDKGKYTTTAKYLEHDPNLAWVKLRVIRGTGDKRVVKDVTIPLEKLSKVCQARVRQIGVLSEKVADAVEAEKDKEKKDADGEERAGELPEERMPGDEPRGGRGGYGGYDAGLAGMDAGEVVAEGGPFGREPAPESAPPRPIAATNNGPPLPALLPPLPSDRLRPSTLVPVRDAPNPTDAPAEETPAEETPPPERR
jgi:hypothetical protein